jgi:hypothetical protein
LIGAGVAVLTVVLSPSAPATDAIISEALAPLHRCAEILRAIASGTGSQWTPEQAADWRQEALGLVDATAKARDDQEKHQLNARWNARAHQDRPVLERVEGALRAGERIAIHTRSIARALVDGSAAARPIPALSTMLSWIASAIDAYAAWAASADTPTDRRRLSETVRAADNTLGDTLTTVQQRWGNDPSQWLTFGTALAMSQRILAEVGRPLELP